jgi:hypothetical protein
MENSARVLRFPDGIGDSRADRPISVFCPFASPGNPAGIRFEATAMDRLRQEALMWRQTRQVRSGVLLGHSESMSASGASHLVLTVDDFIAGDNQPGIEAWAWDPDWEALEQQLRARSGQAQCVGYFYADVTGGSMLTPDQIHRMVGRCGPGKALLVAACHAGRMSASFYDRSGPDGTSVRAAYPIALDAIRPEPGEAARSKRVPDAGGAPAAVPKEDLKAPSKWRRFGLVAAIVVLLGLSVIPYRAVTKSAQRNVGTAANSAGLELKAEWSGTGKQWRLSWNRSAESISKAAKGQVSITDGNLKKNIEFTRVELQTVGLLYSALGDDVDFRLKLFDATGGPTAAESIRVLGGTGAPPR